MKSRYSFTWLAFQLVLILFTNISGCRQMSASVHFFTGSWAALLIEAKEQNKPIFVEVHTVWCGPCRLMEKQAFPNSEVAEKFNAQFVNYHIDMEKGEGPMLQKKYSITAVPTLLYLSPNGELIHRSIGYDNVKSLLADADKAIKATTSPSLIARLETAYREGQRDRNFLRMYLIQRANAEQPNPEALETYLTFLPQSDWSSAENISLIARHSQTASSRPFGWLMHYADSLVNDPVAVNKRWAIVKAADRILRLDLTQAKTEVDLDRLVELRRRIDRISSGGKITADNEAFLVDRLRMEFYERTKNQAGYRSLAVVIGNRLMAMSVDSLRAVDAYSAEQSRKRAKALPASSTPDSVAPSIQYGFHSGYVANELNKLTNVYVAIMSAPADLKQAQLWSERALTLVPLWFFLDTQARLLNRQGLKNEAITTQKQVIAQAKAAGENTAIYEQKLVEWQKGN